MMASTFPALAAVAVSSVANSGLGRRLRPVAPSFRVRDERPRDEAAREALLDRSFGPGRFTKTCERLREGRLPADGLSFWHVECGRKVALMLGPLAVDPSYRSAGIGRALIEHGLKRAAKLGHDSVILVGDAPYYGRFGFTASPVAQLVLPGPVDVARFLGLELVPGALAGISGRVVGAGLLVERRGREPLKLAA